MDLIKIGVIVVLFAIIASLDFGAVLAVGQQARAIRRKMVRALTVRVALSVGLFLLLLLAWRLGYIQPHGIR